MLWISAIALFAIWLVVQLVNLLTLPSDIESALSTLAASSQLLLAAAVVLLILNLDPVRERMPWRARLTFGPPYVDADKAILKVISYGGNIAFAGSSYRLPPGATGPVLYQDRIAVPTDFLHVRVENSSRIDARAVRSVLTYFSNAGEAMFRFDGRWADSPQSLSPMPSSARSRTSSTFRADAASQPTLPSSSEAIETPGRSTPRTQLGFQIGVIRRRSSRQEPTP